MEILLMMSKGSSWSSMWPILAIFGVMILLMLVTMIPQRKKQKKAREMMQKLSKGDKVKTIGGFVGEIMAIDDATNSMMLNLGTEEAPVMVTIDKAAIYTVINENPTVVEVEGEKTVAVDETVVKSVDDAEDDAIAQVKAEKKANSKKNKKAQPLAITDVNDSVSDVTEVTPVFEEDMTNNDEKK